MADNLMGGEELNLDCEYLVLLVPRDTVELAVTAKVFYNGELIPVNRKMTFAEVREAFKEAEEGYIPSDAKFVLTEKGKEYLQKLERERE